MGNDVEESSSRALGGIDTTDSQTISESVQNELQELRRKVDSLAVWEAGLREAARALEESETRYQAAIDQAPVGIADVSLDGRFLRINQRLCSIVGYQPFEVISRHLIDFVHPEDRREMETGIETIASGQQTSLALEKRYQRKDGATVWTNTTISLVRDESSDGISIFAALEDITDKKRAEDALKESERKYRALVERVPDVIMRFDREGRHLFASPSSLRLTGLTPEELLFKTHRELGFSETQCEIWETKIQSVFQTGEPIETEYETDGPEGKQIFNWRLLPEYDLDNQIVSVFSIARNVTKQIRAERQYAALFHQMLDGFSVQEIIFDSQGNPVDYKFLSVNPAFEKLTGKRSEEIVDKTVTNVFPQTEKEWIDLFARVARHGKTLRFESHWREFDRYFEVVAFRSGKNLVASALQDITERRRSAEERQRLEQQLHQAQKMEAIGALAGGIAHDFNNILSGVLGYADLAISDAGNNKEVISSIEQVVDAGKRAKELVQQILDFSRQTEQKLRPSRLQHVIKEAAKLLRSSIPTTIEIHANIDEQCPPVLADPTRIHQIAMNLCTNAYQAMENTGGVMEISLARVAISEEEASRILGLRAGNHVCLSVSDTGKGIRPAIRERIFEPYFTTREQGKGTGLGLAVVHSIAKTHKGTVTVESTPGEGSTFRVFLPVCSEEIVKQVRKRDSVPPPKGSEKILLVDDETLILQVGKRSLERLGYEVTTCDNGAQALEIFSRDPSAFDVVVTDLTMPNMTGLELSMKMRAIRDDLPIILCTGFSQHPTEHEIRKIGINGFVLKPVLAKDLARLIRDIV